MRPLLSGRGSRNLESSKTESSQKACKTDIATRAPCKIYKTLYNALKPQRTSRNDSGLSHRYALLGTRRELFGRDPEGPCFPCGRA